MARLSDFPQPEKPKARGLPRTTSALLKQLEIALEKVDALAGRCEAVEARLSACEKTPPPAPVHQHTHVPKDAVRVVIEPSKPQEVSMSPIIRPSDVHVHEAPKRGATFRYTRPDGSEVVGRIEPDADVEPDADDE